MCTGGDGVLHCLPVTSTNASWKHPCSMYLHVGGLLVGFVGRETEAQSSWAWAGAARVTSLFHRQPYGTFSMVWWRVEHVDGEKVREMGMLLGLQSKAPVEAQLPAAFPTSRVTSLEQDQLESNDVLLFQLGPPALELPRQSCRKQRGQNC